MLRNAKGYVRYRTSTVPYDYWCMGKEERSRMEDRKEYQHVPCCLSAALFICYCTLASRTRPDAARGHFAAPCSYQRLAPPSSLLFSIYGHIRPKSVLLYYYYIHTVGSNGSDMSRFESTSFLPIYHNSMTNPSCYQE